MEKDIYWRKLAERIQAPVETKNQKPDTTDLEISFLQNYIKGNEDVLDVGSGSGLIINKLLHYVKHITAVEKFEGFTKFIVEDPKMTVINAELVGFKIRKEYDLTLCFGVAQCFEKSVMTEIYKKLYAMTKPSGLLIVRVHCGLTENIVVNGFSEELGTDYFAEYRQVDQEQQLLKEIGFKNIETFDIFPDTLNVWDNSRHFIFVCQK